MKKAKAKVRKVKGSKRIVSADQKDRPKATGRIVKGAKGRALQSK
jgi:hypothetical protein